MRPLSWHASQPCSVQDIATWHATGNIRFHAPVRHRCGVQLLSGLWPLCLCLVRARARASLYDDVQRSYPHWRTTTSRGQRVPAYSLPPHAPLLRHASAILACIATMHRARYRHVACNLQHTISRARSASLWCAAALWSDGLVPRVAVLPGTARPLGATSSPTTYRPLQHFKWDWPRGSPDRSEHTTEYGGRHCPLLRLVLRCGGFRD